MCSPALENQLALLGEHWLNNTSKVNRELQRLEAILKHWTRSESRRSQTQSGPIALVLPNYAIIIIVIVKSLVIVMSDSCFFLSPQVSEGVCGAQPVAAVCSGASGVLEYAGCAGSSGAGNCQRPSRCFSGEAAPFLSFLTFIDLDYYFIFIITRNSRRPNEILKEHLSSKSIC